MWTDPEVPHIYLKNAGKRLGRYNVPENIPVSDGRQFCLSRLAKKGSNGVVFEAKELESTASQGRLCALKLLGQISQPRIDRFGNEIRVLKELNSPYISAFYASGEILVEPEHENSRSYEIPWVAIQMGAANMRDHIDNKGPLTIGELKGIAHGVCSAIQHVHEKGFIHRDIKPENFVWRSTACDSPMMIDFGIAKRNNEDVSARPMDTFTRITEFVGPVFFSSPELIQYSKDKAHPVDYRSDIFQLGKVFWYLATGKISAGVPSKKECPANGRLRDLVLAMIDDDPDCRPQSLDEIREAVNNI